MATMLQLLLQMSHADLRAVATRLGVRRRGQHSKEQWAAAVAALWLDPLRCPQLVEALAPPTRTALLRLVEVGELPARPFWNTFGTVQRAGRRAGGARKDHRRPWQEPQNAAEELFYSGVLHPLGSRNLARAARVQLPSELRALLQQDAGRMVRVAHSAAASELLHDLGQLLIFGDSQPTLHWLRRRWLHPQDLAALNARLLHPPPPARLRSHRSSPWLSFLTCLAAGADLQADGLLTAAGWAWLHMAPVDQLTALWAAWRSMPDALRAQCGLASAGLGTTGLEHLLPHLPEHGAPFSAAQLADRFLGAAGELDAYASARFPALGDLAAVVRRLLATELAYWGAVQRAPGVHTSKGAFVVTPLGEQLLAGAPAAADLLMAAGTAFAVESRADAIDVEVRGRHPEWTQATLALYASYVAQHEDTHSYRLDAASIARAARQGNRLPALYRALQAGGVRLAPDQQRLLAAWAAHSEQVQLRTATLLETQSPAVLADLLQQPAVSRALGQVLRPTIATVTGPLGALAQNVADAGYGLAGPQPDLHAGGQAGKDGGDGQDGALWLAGMVYAEIGRYVPLPMSPPYAALAELYARLPPAERAALAVQLEEVKASMLRWLDHFAFTPPAEPSDPESWLPLLHAAIAEGKSLALEYFAATRNMVERYVVAPYWLEEHQGVLYLRGDPGTSAPEAISFRLDRIRALEIVDGSRCPDTNR